MPFVDQDRKYTNIGNIGLTITNYGTLGHSFVYWNDRQPSCEYPKGSRIEHLYLGGIWVGAENRRTSRVSVTTAAIDAAGSTRQGEGFEFKNTFENIDTIMIRSTLSGAANFDTNAVSHQDFVSEYSDFDSNGIANHSPLGIRIRQESYAWNFPFADYFVILNYKIYNAGTDTLDSVYVGMWTNPVVRNTNLSGDASRYGYFFSHQGNGFVDSLRMHYTFDFDGQPFGPPADSYLGVKILGSTPFPLFARHTIDSTFYQMATSLKELDSSVHYNAWKFRSTSGDDAYYWPEFDNAPGTSGGRSRYDRLRASLAQNKIDALRLSASNSTNLLSAGPYAQLNPGDSINIVFALICAKKNGSNLAFYDSISQRANLYSYASWAQKAYDGEDINGNNLLDVNEDFDLDGKLDRYVLPQPPRQPKVHASVSNQHVVIYWDSLAESSIDPISKERDFEGYRIYRSNAGADFQNPEDFTLSLSLVGEFDNVGNQFGHNTGFARIRLSNDTTIDGVRYRYRFPPLDAETLGLRHLNGWQYLYAVTAFDTGDAKNNIESLESGKLLIRVVPGTPAVSDKSKSIGVYPNPYYVNAYWDGTTEKQRKIIFYNLPASCTIRIYTLTGDVVAELDHNATTYTGSDIQWYQRFEGVGATPQFSGGEHAWNLVTKFDQALATGLYLFSVEDNANNEVKTGKFLIIK